MPGQGLGQPNDPGSSVINQRFEFMRHFDGVNARPCRIGNIIRDPFDDCRKQVNPAPSRWKLVVQSLLMPGFHHNTQIETRKQGLVNLPGAMGFEIAQAKIPGNVGHKRRSREPGFRPGSGAFHAPGAVRVIQFKLPGKKRGRKRRAELVGGANDQNGRHVSQQANWGKESEPAPRQAG